MKNMKSSNLTKPNWRKSAMKGVTPIVAIIILLLITIALAGAAYTYLSQYFTGLTGKVLQLQDFLCTSNEANNRSVSITFKNIGTQTVTLCSGNPGTGIATGTQGDAVGTSVGCTDLTITKTAGSSLNYSISSTAVSAGSTTVFKDHCAAGSLCSYRFVVQGTALGAIAPSVQC